MTNRRWWSTIFIVSVPVFGLLWSTDESHAVREFALECSENYSQCGGSNLPDSCDLQVALRAEIESSLGIWVKGWDFRHENAWPQDWWEANAVSGGLDTSIMDAIGRADFSFYSGHGTGAANEPNGSWDLHMGHSHDGACQATSPGQIKLGEQSPDGFGNNGDNEYVMLDASCSMVIGERQQVWQNWGPGILMRSHQGLAFHGSPDDVDDRGEEFIENVADGDSNRSAWLDAGESCFLWVCWNSPAVMTFGANAADALDRHRHETMSSPRADAPSGWGGHYRWEFIDNGGC
ncbi:MAG TPA: DUF6345 domain-containing protein [Methylomirabilota bacterium]